ncbi:hypothetical protein EMGBS15_14830 [Filimonas sp.]|nr:hypothetical protein EMGBS15_14830 [Filimonas sp.]
MNTTVLETPFTPLQAELLKVCNRRVTDEQLMEIKDMISKYFCDKMTQAADKAWVEKGYNEDTINKWLNK